MNQNISKDAYENVLKNATLPVILYMHGNSGNRASSHRVELYKLFQNLDYHLICYDYRSKDIVLKNNIIYNVNWNNFEMKIKFSSFLLIGYGDSENADLSEMGVVTDSKFVLEWIMKIVNGSAPVFVWGHSLGTG